MNKPKTAASSYPGDSKRRNPWGRALYGRSRPADNIGLSRDARSRTRRSRRKPRSRLRFPLRPAADQVTITIDVQPEEAVSPVEEGDAPFRIGAINPKDSDRVFVDVTAYNSKNLLCSLAMSQVPREDCLSRAIETVIDALQLRRRSSYLLPNPKRFISFGRLGAASRPGFIRSTWRPSRTGEIRRRTTRFFPGDRLVVGRNDVVKKTIQLDRLAAPLQTVVGSMLQESFLLRVLQFVSPDRNDATLRDLVEFWVQEMNAAG